MKVLLSHVLLSLVPLTACVQITDFSGEDEGSDTSGASHSNTSVEPTDSGDTQESDTGASCGNGMLDPDEMCDDANAVNGDGCQTDCTVTGGETIWTVEDPALAYGYAVAALADGGFVVTLGFDSGVRRFDANGQEVWAQVPYSEDELVTLTAIAPSPDGDVIVLGMIETGAFLGELWVAELSAADGSEQWAARPAFPGAVRGEAIAVDAEGRVRIAGLTGDETDTDVFMAGVAADGTPEWWEIGEEQRRGDAIARDVVVLPDGSAVFVGTSELGPSLWARRIGAAGQPLWTTAVDEVQGKDASIERRGDGTLMIVSSDVGPGNGDHTVVIELDEGGIEQGRSTWIRDGVTSQVIYGTALAGDDTLYVAGTTDGTINGLYGALDQHGEHRWSQLFVADDIPNAIAQDAAVLADGSVVFVGLVGYATGEAPWHFWMRKTGP